MKMLPLLALLIAGAALAQDKSAPAIPHSIDGYDVTRKENDCLECHDRPREIGKKRAKGLSPPAPVSHYGKLEGKPELADAHFICTTCHSAK
jgi:nitrate reductase cytochrome c-type subunit